MSDQGEEENKKSEGADLITNGGVAIITHRQRAMELQQVMDNLKGMLKAISKEKKLTDLALGPSGGGLSPTVSS